MTIRIDLIPVTISLVSALALVACGPGGGGEDEGSSEVTILQDVQDDQDGETSLREAIEHARSAGETVTFEASLDGSIKLTGGAIVLDGAEAVSIDGGDRITLDAGELSRHFEGNGPDLTLDAITLTAGLAESGSDGGGSILMKEGKLTVRGASFTANKQASDIGYGGAIHIAEAASLDVTDATFEGNLAAQGGGGIYSASSSTVTIAKTTFTKNTDAEGGASHYGASVMHVGDGDMTISGSEVDGEKSDRGAVYMSTLAGALTISDTAFSNNEADYGAAVYFEYSGTEGSTELLTLDIDDATFTSNTSVTAGGAIYVSAYSKTMIDNTTFDGNSVTQTGEGGGAGGAISSNGTIDATITRFERNSAGDRGGAINVGGLTNEQSIKLDRCVVAENNAAQGGAVYAAFNKSIVFEGTTFSDNSATGNGGAVSMDGESILVNGSDFRDNTAGDEGRGGAIYVSEAMSISDSILTGNSADLGGAVYALTADVTLDGTTNISNNTALGESGSGVGGGICNDDADVSLNGANVMGNTPDNFCNDDRVN